MNNYSNDEKKALISLVFVAMIVDRKDSNQHRIKYFQMIADLMAIDNAFLDDALKSMNFDNAVRIISTMTERERARIAIVIFQMFVVDEGEISENQKNCLHILTMEHILRMHSMKQG